MFKKNILHLGRLIAVPQVILRWMHEEETARYITATFLYYSLHVD